MYLYSHISKNILILSYHDCFIINRLLVLCSGRNASKARNSMKMAENNALFVCFKVIFLLLPW